MSGLNPPFRADHVGSLLRPLHLKEARDRFQRNEITTDELRAVEDDAIRDVVRKQEAIGLQSITDGEFRRTFFHLDFLQRLQGVAISGGIATKFHTRDGDIDFAPPRVTVTGKLRHVQDIQTADFQFLRSVANRTGDDPNELPHAYAALINSVIDARPADLTVAIHLCRGNMRSAWVAEGGYEPVAEALFNELHVDAYFLEYDDARSGTFEPLRFVPAGKVVVLGLVTTKIASLEPVADIVRRIEEAARYVPLERLCLSPQCGFASTVHGNQITEAQQWAKLERILEVAAQVWGTVAV